MTLGMATLGMAGGVDSGFLLAALGTGLLGFVATRTLLRTGLWMGLGAGFALAGAGFLTAAFVRTFAGFFALAVFFSGFLAVMQHSKTGWSPKKGSAIIPMVARVYRASRWQTFARVF